MPGICCYVTTVTRYKLSRSQLSAPICRRCSSLGWFVPLLNIQPIQWVSSKVRSLISWWFIGFKVHWTLSWLQPTPPKKPKLCKHHTFFLGPPTLWMMPHSDENSAPSPQCVKAKKKKRSTTCTACLTKQWRELIEKPEVTLADRRKKNMLNVEFRLGLCVCGGYMTRRCASERECGDL